MNESQATTVRDDLVPLDEERVVIERIQNGQTAALGTLYEWYGDKLYRQVVLPRLPDPPLAEDALRDTFKTALEKIGTYQVIDRSIFFWLRRIAANKAIDIHRRTKRDHALVEAAKHQAAEVLHSSPAAPDRGLDIADTRQMVDTSLSRINPRYATALRMRLIEDQPREVCAAALDISVATFDVLFHRACKAFRKGYPP